MSVTDPGQLRTIAVHPAAFDWLMAEAQARGENVPEAVDHLIEELEHWKLAMATASDYCRLRHDPEAWEALRRAVGDLDGTTADGLAAFPWGEP